MAKIVVLFGIYAPAQLWHKDQIWEHSVELSTAIDSPWCLIGDFNEIGAPNGKKGGQLSLYNKYV